MQGRKLFATKSVLLSTHSIVRPKAHPLNTLVRRGDASIRGAGNSKDVGALLILKPAWQFIYISVEEMEAVAAFIRRKGRVAITELAAKSDELIDLAPKDVEPADAAGLDVFAAGPTLVEAAA